VEATRTAIISNPSVVPVGLEEWKKTQAGEAIVGAQETRFGPGLKPVGQEAVAEVDAVEVEGQAEEPEAGLGGGDAEEEFPGSPVPFRMSHGDFKPYPVVPHRAISPKPGEPAGGHEEAKVDS
jgi:hypothetical protein